jgi:hypothetical protein
VLSFSGFVPLKKGEKKEKKRENKFLNGKKKKKNGGVGVGGRDTKFNNSDTGRNNNNALMY